MKHANVALFVPNNGCPHACSFCNQRTITGKAVQPTPDDVTKAVGVALKSGSLHNEDAEIAFFGGSFTAVEHNYMLSLLEAAAPFVRNGTVSGIRISTRPDAVGEEMLCLLKKYGVTTIELGAQSMNDAVLSLNGRGHTAKQVENAAKRIRAYGFSLGLQMMTGLPGDSDAGAWETARRLAELHPECVRIYPAIVIRGTQLGKLFLSEAYQPPSLEETVELCARLLDFFEGKGIPVIRLGLHASPELERDRLAGPWHPAFRELCESRRMLQKFTDFLTRSNREKGNITVRVSPHDVSAATGQKKCNLRTLETLGYLAKIVPDPAVERRSFMIE